MPNDPNKHKPGANDNEAEKDRKRMERQLEKGLEDSFPASDPVSVSEPAKTKPEDDD